MVVNSGLIVEYRKEEEIMLHFTGVWPRSIITLFISKRIHVDFEYFVINKGKNWD